MTTTTATKMVEIQLTYDLTIGKPIRREDGTLGVKYEKLIGYSFHYIFSFLELF